MPKTRTKRTIAEENQNRTIIESVKNLKPDDVITEIGNLQVGLQGTLAGLSATITSKIEQMQNIDSAISLKEQALRELYDIEKEAISLEEMRLRKSEEMANWDHEVATRQKQWDDEAKDHATQWTRLAEQRAYEANKLHKERVESLEADFRRIKRDESIRQEDLKRQWMERENALKNQEEEVLKLKEQVASFDEKVKEAVTRAEAVVSNSVKRTYEHQMQLMEKDHDAERKICQSKLASADATIKALQLQVQDLQTELRSVREDAKDVTAKALESASQRQTAAAFQRAVENANAASAGKK